MEKKSGPGDKDTPAQASKEVTKSIRHRFAEGETSVMPLADVLRSRDRGPLLSSSQKASDHSESTQLVQSPLGPRRSSAPGAVSQQATQVAKLTAAQAALLSRTEPVATPTQTPKQGAPTASQQASAQPARKEISVRTTLSSLNRAGDAAAVVTHPTARPVPPKALLDAVASSVAEVVDAQVKAQAPTAATAPVVSAQPGKRQRVANGCIVVFSCKGGSGATMLGLNTAFVGAKNGHTSCIVDLDLQMGDALAGLGLSPRYNIAQATSGLQEHVALSKNLLPTHDSGVAVLSQVGNLDDMDKVTPESMAALVMAVRQTFDVVVVDGVRDFCDNVLAVLDVAEKIVVVTVQEVLAVRRARWAFGILRRIGFDPQDITIVLNRYSPTGDISLSSLQSMFEPALVVTVPVETVTVTQSLNRGVPLLDARSQTPVMHAVHEVCSNAIYDTVVMEMAAQNGAAKPQHSMWRRIFKRAGEAP